MITQSYTNVNAVIPVSGVNVPVVARVDINGNVLGSAQGVEYSTVGGSSTTAIASGATAATVIKNSAGRLCRVLLTTANGAAAVSIFDNSSAASGTIIGYIAASAVAGTVVDFQMPAANGITVGGASTNPAMTISFY